MTTTDQTTFEDTIKQRFSKLPSVVQKVITSSDVEHQLRDLCNSLSLHVDQYQALENEVLIVLMGIDEFRNLPANIQKEVGVTAEQAAEIVKKVNAIVFEPIRAELERELGHPEAKEENIDEIERVRREAIVEAKKEENGDMPRASAPATAPAPTAPKAPAPPPLPASDGYKPGETSASRTIVIDDPYRVPPE